MLWGLECVTVFDCVCTGMTKIKMSKEEAVSNDFVEKRRAALER